MENDEVMMLRHKLEQMEGRMIRLLSDSADMLDTGLAALRKTEWQPRVAVMQERASAVADDLRAAVRDIQLNR